MKNTTDYNKFSLQTRIKLQVKIEEIRKYFLFYEDYKNKFNESLDYDNTSPKKIFQSMAHRAIYVLYRSLFKSIEKKRIDVMEFTENEDIIDAHKSIMNLTDKDICHHDKNSKSFKVVDINSLIDGKGTSVSQDYLSDEQLKIAVEFLVKDILPKIQDTSLK